MGIHRKIYGLGWKIRVNTETGLTEDYMNLLCEIGLHSSEYTKWKIPISTTKLGLKPNLRKEDEDAPVVQAAEPAAPRPEAYSYPGAGSRYCPRGSGASIGTSSSCSSQKYQSPRLKINQSCECTGVLKNG